MFLGKREIGLCCGNKIYLLLLWSVPLDEQKQNVTQNHPLEYPSFSLTLQTVFLQSFATSYYCFEALGLIFPRISTVKPTVTTFSVFFICKYI